MGQNPRLTPTSRRVAVSLAFLTLTILLAACAPKAILPPDSAMNLAAFSENSVDVSIALTRDAFGQILLTATFTPPPDHHLYGKDIPRNGVEGLGRPTLIELSSGSKIQIIGQLLESVAPINEPFEALQLPVYPAGAVTLSLPILLPPSADWVDETVIVTFMACGDNGCKPPVMGKVVAIRIPGADLIAK
ncbi:MAG: hypothetical protein HY867_17505 [Chloroflexi bacterium]|nr:hypothetical protein [Chloroflexota bacterium]